MAENVHVSSVLAGIFPDNESKEDLEERKEETASNFPGLDAKHAAFLGELLPRPHWEEAEFVTLAGQFRLMQAGALENLNEWSYVRFGGVLIEEDEGYNLTPEIVAQLQKEGTNDEDSKD